MRVISPLPQRRHRCPAQPVDGVETLVSAGAIPRDAIRAVAKRRTLPRDGRGEDFPHRVVNPLPLPRPQATAGQGGVNAGAVENLRGVEVPHARQCPLVHQGRLDRPAACPQTLPQRVGGEFQRVRAKPLRAIELLELLRGRQPHDAQPALVPKEQLARRAAGKHEDQTHSPLVGRVGQEDEAGHPRLDDDAVAAVQFQDDAFAQPTDGDDRPADDAAAELGQGGMILIAWSLNRGFRSPATRQPAIAAIPRRIVSTSGSSGMGRQGLWGHRLHGDLEGVRRRLALLPPARRRSA